MLFVLNGDIQTGKTRWLCDVCKEIASMGIAPYGVVAPGVWRRPEEKSNVTISGGLSCPEVDAIDWEETPSRPADANGFEKLGITNALLPSLETILFALRRDIAVAAGKLDEDSQSEKAKLGWHMSDEAIGRVNDHLGHAVEQGALEAAGIPGATQALLVVDELGRLELMRDAGLTNAIRLLDQGPTETCPHALVVVRSQLAYIAEDCYSDKWGCVMTIRADDSGRGVLLGTLRCARR